MQRKVFMIDQRATLATMRRRDRVLRAYFKVCTIAVIGVYLIGLINGN